MKRAVRDQIKLEYALARDKANRPQVITVTGLDHLKPAKRVAPVGTLADAWPTTR